MISEAVVPFSPQSIEKRKTFKDMRKLFSSRIFWSLLIILLALRFIAPSLILKSTNSYLENFSPIYRAHIHDLDMGILRGAYKVKGVEVALKNQAQRPFLTVRSIDVSLAWRELLKFHITTDVAIDEARTHLSDAVLKALKEGASQDQTASKKAFRRIFPVRIERVDLRNSNFQFADFPSLTNIHGRLSNVTATSDVPLSLLSMQANVFNSNSVKMVANINTVAEPIAWDIDVEMRNFNLPDANTWLKQKVPFTFTSGKLDLYSEARSEKGRIEGYVKPFVHKADIISSAESFQNLKQFGIEISTATANMILRDSKTHTMASKILFAFDNGHLQVNETKALSEAFKNGFSAQIPEGIDDEIHLSRHAQGEKP
jgi:hypothetical protein